jgi:hypothetical protein|tara:strand:- start:699 stop:938 length:240 start_codon:yes stop_codon:yes gene_type:complete
MQVNHYIEFNDKLLIIKRTVKESHLKPNFDQQILKKWTRSDILLKKNGIYYCCETLAEAVIIEDVDEVNPQLQLEFPEE